MLKETLYFNVNYTDRFNYFRSTNATSESCRQTKPHTCVTIKCGVVLSCLVYVYFV